jgi:YD repeat-containing protein
LTIPDTSSDFQNLCNWYGGISQAVLNQLIPVTGIPTSSPTNGRHTVDHVWVKATINGTINGTTYSGTYDLDPSYKQRNLATAIDYKTASGYSRSQLITDALSKPGSVDNSDYTQNLNRPAVESRLGQYSSNLRQAIQTNPNYANVEMAQIVGGGPIYEQSITSLSQGAPLAAFSPPANPTTFTSIPPAYVTTYEVQIDTDIDYLFNADSLQGTRLSLTFSGYNAQLWLGDTMLQQQSAGSASPASVKLIIKHPYTTLNQTLPVSYNRLTGSTPNNYDLTYAFFPNPQSSGRIDASNRQLQNYLASGKTDSSREVLTEALHALGLKWTRQVALSVALTARIQNAFGLIDHVIGRSGQEAGYYVDMPGVYGTTIDSSGTAFHAINSGAFLMSAMEHGDIEESTGTTALSTIRCLALANDAGKMIFKATSSNFAGTVQPNLVNDYTSSQLSTFTNLVNGGATVLLHQNAQTTITGVAPGSNQWAGFGYASMTNQSVGMIISGNYHGGYASGTGTISGTGDLSIYTSQSTQHIDLSNLPPITSAEPVDLLTGAYTMSSADLTLGQQGSPRGLNFTRYYDGTRNFQTSALGNGWRHSCEGKITLSSELDNAFGLTQPTDAVQTIVGALAAGDFADTSMSPKELMVGALAANWTINRIKNNAANVRLGNQSMTYISLPDGSWNPPPGSTTDLHGSKGSFSLKPRFCGNGGVSFDAQDRIFQWKDVDGNTQSFSYDGSGHLTGVTDQFGRKLTFNYYSSGVGNGLISSVSDSAGRSVQFSYTGGTYSGANLTQITDPEGNKTTLVYDSNGRNRITDWLDSAGLKVYALPPGAPRDAYYVITIDPRDNPYIGPTVVQRQPQWNEPGGGNEVKILGPIRPGQIQGPFPLPPNTPTTQSPSGTKSPNGPG